MSIVPYRLKTMLELNKDFGFAVAIGVGIGMAVGWVIRGRTIRNFIVPKAGATPLDLTDDCLNMATDGEYKMVIVVRTDLKMGKGKAAAQCAHGALGAAEKAFKNDQETFMTWKCNGQPKVVVKTDTEQSLRALGREASSVGLTTCIIRDAGRTQIAAGSQTVLAVGPGPGSLVDKVTGHLKLY